LLWIAVGLATLVYRWVGRILIGQPAFNRPPIFYNESTATAAIAAAPIAFVAIIALGFLLTESGWYYLSAVAILCVVFAVRPRR
jgi:hypothetical protein